MKLVLIAVEPECYEDCPTLNPNVPVVREPRYPEETRRIGKLFKDIRYELGIHLHTAAEALEITVVELSALEHGAYSFDMVAAWRALWKIKETKIGDFAHIANGRLGQLSTALELVSAHPGKYPTLSKDTLSSPSAERYEKALRALYKRA